MLSTWPQEPGFLDTRLQCKAAGTSGLLALRSQAGKISEGSTHARHRGRWHHAWSRTGTDAAHTSVPKLTEATSATRKCSPGDSESPLTIHAVPFLCWGLQENLHPSRMMSFAEFSQPRDSLLWDTKRLLCSIALDVTSSTLLFSLQSDAPYVKNFISLLHKRGKKGAIQLHQRIFNPVTLKPCPERFISVPRHPTGTGAGALQD